MTLVVGAHFGNLVGISADTRVTCRHKNGEVRYADDALKIYQFPPFLVGIAGSAIPAMHTLHEFRRENFPQGPSPESFRLSGDLDWMARRLVSSYENISQEIEGQRFRLVFATCPSFLDPPHEAMNWPLSVKNGISKSFTDSTRPLTQGDQKQGLTPLVFCVSFPDRQVTTAEPGAVLVAGSGAKHESFLMEKPSMMAVNGIGPGDPMASVGRDMITVIETAGDSSVNAFIMGATIGPSILQYTIHSHIKWPSDTKVPSTRWVPMNQNEDQTHVLKADDYSVGLDMAAINVGWIYDSSKNRKLPTRSLFDGTFLIDHETEYIL